MLTVDDYHHWSDTFSDDKEFSGAELKLIDAFTIFNNELSCYAQMV